MERGSSSIHLAADSSRLFCLLVGVRKRDGRMDRKSRWIEFWMEFSPFSTGCIWLVQYSRIKGGRWRKTSRWRGWKRGWKKARWTLSSFPSILAPFAHPWTAGNGRVTPVNWCTSFIVRRKFIRNARKWWYRIDATRHCDAECGKSGGLINFLLEYHEQWGGPARRRCNEFVARNDSPRCKWRISSSTLFVALTVFRSFFLFLIPFLFLSYFRSSLFSPLSFFFIVETLKRRGAITKYFHPELSGNFTREKVSLSLENFDATIKAEGKHSVNRALAN